MRRSIFTWLRRFLATTPVEGPDPCGPGATGPVDLSGDDTIDLHAFRPKDLPSVVREFLDCAVRAGHDEVRIIHGKGTGQQRALVRKILGSHPAVRSFRDAPDASGWGATLARLAPPKRQDSLFTI